MQEQEKVTGIVLSTYDIGENTVRLTILTAELGKIHVFANGAKRQNNHYSGCCNKLSFAEFMVKSSKDAYQLVSAEPKEVFTHLYDDMYRIFYASYFAEMADYFTSEGLKDLNILNLLYVTLKAMKKEEIPLTLVRRIFEFKMMQFYGLGMQTDVCFCCGTKEGPFALALEQGGLICRKCSGENHPFHPIGDAVQYTLSYVAWAPLNKLYTFVLKDDVRIEFEWIVKRYMTMHLDHTFKSAKMLETL